MRETGRLFAQVSFDILDRERFHTAEQSAPGAVALWVWLITYARKHETDGVVPIVVARKGSFGKPARFEHLVATLEGAGLITRSTGTLVVARYADHNETREEINLGRAAWQTRRQNIGTKWFRQLPRLCHARRSRVSRFRHALVTRQRQRQRQRQLI